MPLSVCATVRIQHCNKKGKHPWGETFTHRSHPTPSRKPGAGPGSAVQAVWREGCHGFLPLPHFVRSPLWQTQAQAVRWEQSWSIPRFPQAWGLCWVMAALIVFFSSHRRSDDGAGAAAPPRVVQRIHLVLEPIDVVEVRLP